MKIVLSFTLAVMTCLAMVGTDLSAQAERHGDRSNSAEISSRKKRGTCVDLSNQCSVWKRQGYCNYYRNYCQKTCGFCKVCQDYNNLCPRYAATSYCQSHSYKSWMGTNCPKSCGYCVIKQKPVAASCLDLNNYCAYWTNTGECRRNPKYMLVNCKKSCGWCMTATTKPTQMKTTKPQKKTTRPQKKTTRPQKKTTKPQKKTTRQPNQVCGIPTASVARIVGGRFALPGDWPWHVAITSCRGCSLLPFCGGTLINNEWIVTAGHCVQSRLPSDIYVIVGDTNVLHKSGHEMTVGVKSIFIHNSYSIAAAYDYDVSLLRLKKRVQFSNFIKPACLPSVHSMTPAGTNCTVTGFGRISENGPKSARLQQATVPLVDGATCKKAYINSTITTNMLCAGHAKGGIDACQGDSGGPLVCKKSDGSWQLSGIVSWGKGCARKNRYGIYADVQVLRAWIEKTIASQSSG